MYKKDTPGRTVNIVKAAILDNLERCALAERFSWHPKTGYSKVVTALKRIGFIGTPGDAKANRQAVKTLLDIFKERHGI